MSKCHAAPTKIQKRKRRSLEPEAADPSRFPDPRVIFFSFASLGFWFWIEPTTQEMAVNDLSSSSSAETSNFVPNCALLLSWPKFVPFLGTSAKKPNFVAPNIVVIGELVHTSVVSAAEKCFGLLHSFASQNPLLKKLLSLPNEFQSFRHQVSISLLCGD